MAGAWVHSCRAHGSLTQARDNRERYIQLRQRSQQICLTSERTQLGRNPAVSGQAATASTPELQSATAEDADWEAKYNAPLDYGTAALQGPRQTMEDKVSVISRGRCGFLVASLFDGHGTGAAAEWLNHSLYSEFSEAVDDQMLTSVDLEYCETAGLDAQTGICCPVGLRDVLTRSFQQADHHLLDHLAGLPEKADQISGATATVVLLRRDKIFVANVGDSRAVLCRKGRPIDLSTEHRLYGTGPAVEAEVARVEASGGWVSDGRVCDVLAVSRAFGDRQFKGTEGLRELVARGVEDNQWDQEFADAVHFASDPVIVDPDVTEMLLKDGDEFIIIASDGLWDIMPSSLAVQQARNAFKKGFNAQQVAERLAELAIKRYTTDNVAVVVVDLGTFEKANNGGSSKGQGLFGIFNR